jgi:hypothetical protein
VLALLGCGVATGCLSQTNADTPDPPASSREVTNPTRTNSKTREFPVVQRSTGETVETQSGLSVTVQNPRLAKAVVVNQHTSPVGMAPDSQFVVADVVADKPSDWSIDQAALAVTPE